MMLMGFNSQLGDVTDILSSIPGVTDAETAALDKVKATVQPYVVASLLMGLFGFAFGLAALIDVRNLKQSRGAS